MTNPMKLANLAHAMGWHEILNSNDIGFPVSQTGGYEHAGSQLPNPAKFTMQQLIDRNVKACPMSCHSVSLRDVQAADARMGYWLDRLYKLGFHLQRVNQAFTKGTVESNEAAKLLLKLDNHVAPFHLRGNPLDVFEQTKVDLNHRVAATRDALLAIVGSPAAREAAVTKWREDNVPDAMVLDETPVLAAFGDLSLFEPVARTLILSVAAHSTHTAAVAAIPLWLAFDLGTRTAAKSSWLRLPVQVHSRVPDGHWLENRFRTWAGGPAPTYASFVQE